MPSKEDTIRLRHMEEAADQAMSYVVGRLRCDLNTDTQLVHAVVRCIEIIGEAARQISSEFKTGHPEIEWSAIIGMRNRLIHAYFDINLDIVWQTVVNELPQLRARVRQILNG